jgi:hypothetical protein
MQDIVWISFSADSGEFFYHNRFVNPTADSVNSWFKNRITSANCPELLPFYTRCACRVSPTGIPGEFTKTALQYLLDTTRENESVAATLIQNGIEYKLRITRQQPNEDGVYPVLGTFTDRVG